MGWLSWRYVPLMRFTTLQNRYKTYMNLRLIKLCYLKVCIPRQNDEKNKAIVQKTLGRKFRLGTLFDAKLAGCYFWDCIISINIFVLGITSLTKTTVCGMITPSIIRNSPTTDWRWRQPSLPTYWRETEPRTLMWTESWRWMWWVWDCNIRIQADLSFNYKLGASSQRGECSTSVMRLPVKMRSVGYHLTGFTSFLKLLLRWMFKCCSIH